MENIRYAPPSNLYDMAPYGFVVKVIGDNGKSTLYIQLNDDNEDKPNWTPISEFLRVIFEDDFSNKESVYKLLEAYEKKLTELSKS